MGQNPIGKSSRSNPITYLGIYDDIRSLMASQSKAKIEGITAKHFSFNVDGGRCEECKGEGEITLEMQFMADVKITCEECEGTRFKKQVLGIRYQNKNIDDILHMTIQQAYDFFNENKATTIAKKISALVEVGLGYLKVGQSSNTLSGGEAQRVKLAYFLNQKNEHYNQLYIFDEPTTGLHYYDISLLMKALAKLIENENSVVLIEHNMEVVKEANWIVDIGPDAGKNGGEIVAEGTPMALMKQKSHTARALQGKY